MARFMPGMSRCVGLLLSPSLARSSMRLVWVPEMGRGSGLRLRLRLLRCLPKRLTAATHTTPPFLLCHLTSDPPASRVRHDHHPPGTSEDVDILRVDCFTWVRTACSATLTDAHATIAMFRNSNEDVNTESVRLPRLGKGGVVQLQRACVGARDGTCSLSLVPLCTVNDGA